MYIRICTSTILDSLKEQLNCPQSRGLNKPQLPIVSFGVFFPVTVKVNSLNWDKCVPFTFTLALSFYCGSCCTAPMFLETISRPVPSSNKLRGKYMSVYLWGLCVIYNPQGLAMRTAVHDRTFENWRQLVWNTGRTLRQESSSRDPMWTWGPAETLGFMMNQSVMALVKCTYTWLSSFDCQRMDSD